jgi:hypothetical protein
MVSLIGVVKTWWSCAVGISQVRAELQINWGSLQYVSDDKGPFPHYIDGKLAVGSGDW